MSLKIALILASMLTTADFLQCYSCDSVIQRNCSVTMTCPEDKNYCSSKKIDLFGHSFTEKGCGSEGDCGGSVDIGGLKIFCCEEDLCNSASILARNPLLLLAFHLLSIILLF